jgi:hypothetical protein
MKIYDWVKESLRSRLSYHQLENFRNFRSKLQHKCNIGGNKVLRHMNEIIAQRPIKIGVETYSLCNARCVFCARRKLRASRQLMSMPLFGRICAEYAAMGGGFLGFAPLLADPLLDPLLLERIRLMRKSFPTIHPHMITNGIALKNFSDDELAEMLSIFDHIDISIGGLTREDYKTMYGVDKFDQVKESLYRLIKVRETISSSCPLELHIRTHRRNEVVNSLELSNLRKLGYVCNDIIDSFADWGAVVNEKDLPEGTRLKKKDNSKCNISCAFPMIYMQIMPDGLVLGCACMDAKMQTPMGHLEESNLQSIWQGRAFSNLRSSFQRGELYPPCMTCAYYSNSEILLSRPGLKNFEPSKDFWQCI